MEWMGSVILSHALPNTQTIWPSSWSSRSRPTSGFHDTCRGDKPTAVIELIRLVARNEDSMGLEVLNA